MSIERVRLHIKNNRAGEEIFRVTPERLADARSRHPDADAWLDTTLEWDLDEFESHIGRAHGLVTWDLPTDDLAERAPNLRWIHIIGAGVEHLQPLGWVPEFVSITNNRGVHADKAAEYGLMAVLMLNNSIPDLVTMQRRRTYVERFTSTLAGTTLVVVGPGHMGSAVAAAVRPFGVRTVGVARTPGDRPGFDEMVTTDDLDAVLPGADFMLVTTPLTAETRGLIDERRFGLMQAGVGIINMGRAPVIDEDALVSAIESGHVSGAVLDVFEPEPLPSTSRLWDLPNVVMTPHMSSDDAVHYTPKTLDLVFENARRLHTGEPLINVVDLTLGY